MAFDIRLRLYSDDKERGRVIQTSAITVSGGEAALTTLSFTTTESLSTPFLVGVEYAGSATAEYASPRSNLFIVTKSNRDALSPDKTATFTGTEFVPWLLARHYVKHGSNPWTAGAPRVKDGARNFASPGHAMMILIREGRTNAWGHGLTFDFDDQKDSAGQDWQQAENPAPLQVFVPIWQVLTTMSGSGLTTWWTEGMKLRMFRPGYGVDRSSKVVIGGSGFNAAPVDEDFDEVLTHIGVVYDNNTDQVYVENPGADNRFGNLLGVMTQSGVKKRTDAERLARPALAESRSIKRSRAYDWSPVNSVAPWRDFNVGDTVTARTNSGKTPLRVVGLVVTKTGDETTARVVLGSRITKKGTKQASQIQKGSLGTIVGGNGAQVPAASPPMKATPDAPTGLRVDLNSGWYDQAGSPGVTVAFAWNVVTTAIDDSDIDTDQYEVWFRDPDGASRLLVKSDENRVVVETLVPGAEKLVKVRARSVGNQWSKFSPEISVTPEVPTPPVPDPPSAPLLATDMAQVLVTWDGKLTTGAPGLHVRGVYIEAAPAATGPWKKVSAPFGEGVMPFSAKAAGVAVGETAHVRLRAVNSRGVASEPSVVRTIVVDGVKAPDIDKAVNDAIAAIDVKAGAAGQKAEQAVQDALTAKETATNAGAAAAAASGIASSKSTTLIQSSTPAAEYRNSLTLWIDTTGGANTPKRWSGSTWLAVTDKVAVDAAAAAVAAQNAASSAQSAADAANAAASAAQGTANTAVSKAATAQGAADSAASAATAARKVADEAAARAQNVLPNWSFEDGNAGWYSDSSMGSATHPSYIVASGTARDGSFVHQRTTTASNYVIYSKRQPSEAGRVWQATARVRKIGSETAGRVQVALTTPSLQTAGQVSANLSAMTGGDWFTVTTRWTSTSAEPVGLRLVVLSDIPAGVVIEWDAIELKDVTEAAAAQAKADAAQSAADAAAASAAAAQSAAGAAQTTADAAIASASGRNAMYHATTAPSGTGTRAGDIWHQWSTMGINGRLLATWVWSGTAWQQRLLDETYIPLLNIGSGTYGSLNGDRMQANSIAARSLILADFTNRVAGGDFDKTADLLEWYGGNESWNNISTTSTYADGSAGSLYVPASAVGTRYIHQIIPVRAGVKYRIGWSVRVGSGYDGSDGNGKIRIGDASGGGTGLGDLLTGWAWRDGSTAVNSQVRVTKEWTAPAGVSAISFAAVFDHSVGNVWVALVNMREMNAADLIVDGDIKGRHVDAENMWADLAFFNQAKVNLLKAGAIETWMLAVGAKPAQGTEVNRIPAVLTDVGYWSKVIDGSVQLGSSSSVRQRVTATSTGILLQPTSTQNARLQVTASTPVPPSRAIYVQFATTGPPARVLVYWRSDTDYISSSVMEGSSGVRQITAPDVATNYDVSIVVDAGGSTARVTSLQVFEVIGANGSQQHVEIAPSGLRLFNTDGDRVVSLSTDGDDLISISKKNAAGEIVTVAGIDEDGNGTLQSLEVSYDATFQGSPLVGSFAESQTNGTDLADIPMFDRLARGVIAVGNVGGSGYANVTHQRAGLASFQVDLRAGRVYRFEFYGNIVSEWMGGSGSGDLSMEIHWSTNTQSISNPQTTNGGWSHARILNSGADTGLDFTYSYIAFREFVVQTDGMYNVLLSLFNAPNRPFAFFPGAYGQNPPRIETVDLMPIQAWARGDDSLEDYSTRAYVASSGSSSGSTAPTAPKRVTKTWSATWSVLWGPSGSIRPSGGSLYDDGRMLQGGNTSLGSGRAGRVGFPALGISGKTIVGAWLRVKVRHTGLSSGTTLRIGTHGNGSEPAGSSPNLANQFTKKVSKGQDLWIPIPPSLWAGLASGSIRGFQFGGPNVNSGKGDYVILDGYSGSNAATGSAVRPQLKITYQ